MDKGRLEAAQAVVAIPQSLARTRGAMPGGAEWLQRLPGIAVDCAERWRLRLLPPFAGLSYNYVAPVQRADGSAAVLKLCALEPEFFTVIEALRRYDGCGAARLLQRLQPGRQLSVIADDRRATALAAHVMRHLRRAPPAGHGFPTAECWADGLTRYRTRFGDRGPLSERLVALAERLFTDLLATAEPPVLLHGDLHHFNILSSGDGWLAIDPKGVLGEPAYEAGALLRNPMPQIVAEPDLDRILNRRLRQLSEELGFDRERLCGWGIAQAVLSACAHLEDKTDGWKQVSVCAEALLRPPI